MSSDQTPNAQVADAPRRRRTDKTGPYGDLSPHLADCFKTLAGECRRQQRLAREVEEIVASKKKTVRAGIHLVPKTKRRGA